MEALLGTTVGALLALAGGVIVRRWEAKRVLRAQAYVELVVPILGIVVLLRNRQGQVRVKDAAGLGDLARDLSARSLAIGSRDYELSLALFDKAVAVPKALIVWHNYRAGPTRSEDVVTTSFENYRIALQELEEAAGDYTVHVRSRLLSRVARRRRDLIS